MKITVIIPAFNEVAYLGATLDSIRSAASYLRTRSDVEVDVIVVDNNSDDGTAAVARDMGATLVREPEQGVARARNTGARHAEGDLFVFIDADVIVPPVLLDDIREAMSDPDCVGGAVDVDYRPRSFLMRLYLRAWRLLARLTGMAQGATQFCRRDVFEQVGGYDEGAWIGEDVDFYWSLRKFAKARSSTVRLIRHTRVRPSARRFDEWPIWKTLILTNPLFIAMFRRRKRFWGGWYSRPVR